jgi:aminoglycoside/choline kinase family phosphotransferase
MIRPDYVKKHDKEARRRDVSLNEAWDDVNYVDLETDDDFVQKFQAIVAGTEYDTRVQVPVDFTDEELLTYMKAAHELDISFNEFVVRAITQAIQAHDADPAGFGQRYNT